MDLELPKLDLDLPEPDPKWVKALANLRERQPRTIGQSEAGSEVPRMFAENLKELRRGRGLSQESAADRAGLARTEVSLLERGLRTPRLDTIVRLGGALEIEPCGLLMGLAIQLDPPPKGGSK
jgi:DNA-binding XRE family transcriptional regulator